MTADPFADHGFGRNQSSPCDAATGHGVGIAAMPPLPPVHPDEWIRAQCECGYAASFNNPVTLEWINAVMSWPHPVKGEAR